MDKRLMHYKFPCDQAQLDGTMVKIRYNIAAVVEDTKEKAIVQAVLDAARASEVTDLYLMDKKFVLDALREKKERENPKPLTLKELLEHLDEPVWVQHLEAPNLSHWGIVEGGSEFDGINFLALRGEHGFYHYGESVVAYLHKPKEVQQ